MLSNKQTAAPAAPVISPTPARPRSQVPVDRTQTVFASDAVKGRERLASSALQHFPGASAGAVIAFCAAMSNDPASSNDAFAAREKAKAAQARREAADATWSRARSQSDADGESATATDSWDRARKTMKGN